MKFLPILTLSTPYAILLARSQSLANHIKLPVKTNLGDTASPEKYTVGIPFNES